MIQPKVQTSPALDKLFYNFTHLPLGGKKIRCPYWMNKIRKGIFGPFGGKGTPRQICKATSFWAKKEGVSLDDLSAEEIQSFMSRKKIGIDCSGFVYRMLGFLAKEKGVKRFRGNFFGVKGKIGAHHVNAECLTNDVNTIPVENSGEIKVGDVIRMKKGGHVAIIIRINLRKIYYAHSSGGVGPHLGIIRILDPQKGLESQVWLEKTKTGKTYGKYFLPKQGDGVRRVKLWA